MVFAAVIGASIRGYLLVAVYTEYFFQSVPSHQHSVFFFSSAKMEANFFL